MPNNVLLSVLNAVDASIFFVCGIIVLSLIFDYKKSNGIVSITECFKQIWLGSSPAVRPAVGFVFLCFGFILKALAIVPYLIFEGSTKADMLFYSFAPWAYFAATISFVVGIAFIMWPTLNRIVLWFVPEMSRKDVSILSIFLLTLGLLLFGLLGYYIHFFLVFLFV